MCLRGDATVRMLREAICNELCVAVDRSRIFANGTAIARDGDTKPLDRIVKSMDVRMWAIRPIEKRSRTYMSDWRQKKTLHGIADIRTICSYITFLGACTYIYIYKKVCIHEKKMLKFGFPQTSPSCAKPPWMPCRMSIGVAPSSRLCPTDVALLYSA